MDTGISEASLPGSPGLLCQVAHALLQDRWRQSRGMPAVAHSRGPSNRGPAYTTDQERNVRFLYRFGGKGHARELIDVAMMAGPGLRPQRLHNRNGFVSAGPALFVGAPHGVQFLRNDPDPHTQHDSATGQHVERRRSFGKAHGMVIRQDQHAGAQADLRGDRRNITQDS